MALALALWLAVPLLLAACRGEDSPGATKTPTVTSPAPSATASPATVATAMATAPPRPTGQPAAKFSFSFGATLLPSERDFIAGSLANVEQALRTSGLPAVPSVEVYAYRDADDLARAFDRPGGRPPEDLEQQLEHHAAQARYRAILINVSSPNWRDATDVQKLRILAHEFVHLLQLELMGSAATEAMLATPPTRVHAGGPAWLFEGAAEVLARRLVDEAGLSDFAGWLDAQKRLAGARPLSLLRLESYLDFAVEGEHAVAHSALAAEMLLRRVPLQGALSLWASVGTGSSWEVGFFGAFGVTPVQFNAEFEAARLNGFR